MKDKAAEYHRLYGQMLALWGAPPGTEEGEELSSLLRTILRRARLATTPNPSAADMEAFLAEHRLMRLIGELRDAVRAMQPAEGRQSAPQPQPPPAVLMPPRGELRLHERKVPAYDMAAVRDGRWCADREHSVWDGGDGYRTAIAIEPAVGHEQYKVTLSGDLIVTSTAGTPLSLSAAKNVAGAWWALKTFDMKIMGEILGVEYVKDGQGKHGT